ASTARAPGCRHRQSVGRGRIRRRDQRATLNASAQDGGGRTLTILRDDYYHLSETVLTVFKALQDFDPSAHFPGSQLEQAYTIWRHSPPSMRNAVLEANGIEPIDKPMLGWGYIRFE
ncbi:MAG: hypothetical protein ACOY7P_11225, partial [Pseudomonadota bacterium]